MSDSLEEAFKGARHWLEKVEEERPGEDILSLVGFHRVPLEQQWLKTLLAAVSNDLPEESIPTKPGSVIRATTPDRPGRQPYFRILDQEDGRNWVALSGKSFSEESFDSWELSS